MIENKRFFTLKLSEKAKKGLHKSFIRKVNLVDGINIINIDYKKKMKKVDFAIILKSGD